VAKDTEVIGNISKLVEKANNTGFSKQSGVRELSRHFSVRQKWFRSGLDYYACYHVDSSCIATLGHSDAIRHMIQLHSFLIKSCQLIDHMVYPLSLRYRLQMWSDG
jgi:hypothetical protein